MTTAKPKTIVEMEEQLTVLRGRRQRAELRFKKAAAELKTLQKRIKTLEEEKFTKACREFGMRLAKENLSLSQVNMEKIAQLVVANPGEYERNADSPLSENPLSQEDLQSNGREEIL